MELGGCISRGVQAYRTVISFLAIRMRSGPPASWRQPRSALGVGAPVILPQRDYGRGDPKVGTLLPAMPADWLAGWLAKGPVGWKIGYGLRAFGSYLFLFQWCASS